jgi:hypothetical protein
MIAELIAAVCCCSLLFAAVRCCLLLFTAIVDPFLQTVVVCVMVPKLSPIDCTVAHIYTAVLIP